MNTTVSVDKFTAILAKFEQLGVDLRTLAPSNWHKGKPVKLPKKSQPSRMTAWQKKDWPHVLKLLRAGKLDNRAIAKQYPSFKWTSIRSYRSHVTMKTYQ